MGDAGSVGSMPKITSEEWQSKLEANRKLRNQYKEDPSKLSEEDQMRAMVLVQRDERKARQQKDKTKKGKVFVPPVFAPSAAAAAAAAPEPAAAAAAAPAAGGDSKITPAEWKEKLEANRKLRIQYTEDPSKLTEDEKTRAMVLLQRDQRKVRQQADKKKKKVTEVPQEFALPSHARSQPAAAKADAAPGAVTPAVPAGTGWQGIRKAAILAAKLPKGSISVHEKLREPIEPPGGYPVGDPRKEFAESLRHAIMDKKRAKREDKAGQSFKSQNEMGWAPQLSGSKLEQQQDLRSRLKSDPSSLSAAEKERAELLVARDERKAGKKAKRLDHRAKRELAANGGVPVTDADKSLAKKWSGGEAFSDKMAAAAAARLKKGLKRGDWECPKCKNNNFARRDKCLKCDEPVPTEHSRWASLGSKEFEDHDAKYWEDKQKEVLEKEIEGTLWDCKQCGIGQFLYIKRRFLNGK